MEYVALGKRLQPCYTPVVVYVVVFETSETSGNLENIHENPCIIRNTRTFLLY